MSSATCQSQADPWTPESHPEGKAGDSKGSGLLRGQYRLISIPGKTEPVVLREGAPQSSLDLGERPVRPGTQVQCHILNPQPILVFCALWTLPCFYF